MKFTAEQINKAGNAKSAEELLEVAKENGVELTEEQAKEYFAELHKDGELTDDELDAVAGGDKDYYEDYTPRHSGYCVCDHKAHPYGSCGFCPNFRHYPDGETRNGCDGYCLDDAWK